MSFEQIVSPIRLPDGVFGFFIKTEAEELARSELTVSDFELPPALLNAVPKRKNEYLLGRFCARIALESAGCSLPPILPHTTGQPPTWPVGFTGSITHTAGLIGAVVASAAMFRGLGLDAEAIMSPERVENLRTTILTDVERSRFSVRAGELEWSEAQLLTAVFSAKEAVYKAHSSLHPERNRFHDVEIKFAAESSTLHWTKPHEEKFKSELHVSVSSTHVVSLVSVLQ